MGNDAGKGEKAYACPICGFHYSSEETAKRCHSWCSTHNACSVEITKHSIEVAGKQSV